MEGIGSQVGLKMRSAIKAKLTELGCYVDDELPDYVMVMVANKRTRSQMEEDLQLFLSNNTEAFVGWLHQVLQKLQEVTINTKLVNLDNKKIKSKHLDGSIIAKKEKDKKKNKDKSKSKEKLKSKSKKYKKEKAKKSMNTDDTNESERIRPNVPRLLMNLEKESSPSITDIFAGQILKSHGITPAQNILGIHNMNEGNSADFSKQKSLKSRFPIIDPATVSQINTESSQTAINQTPVDSFDIPSITEIEKLKSPKIKICETADSSLKKKASESCSDSGSEDVINIRTEAEELLDMGINEDISMNDSNRNEARTPPLTKNIPTKTPKEPVRAPEPDFPQIELNLPKRPLRDRLGVKNDHFNNKRAINTVNPYQPSKQGRNNLLDHNNSNYSERISSKIHFNKVGSKNSVNFREKIPIKQRLSIREKNSDNNLNTKKKLGSRVVSLPNESPKPSNITVAVASVVRAPPRPQNQGISAAPQLLLRAMADAHKSLLNMPPKVETGVPAKKKALVHPIRRSIPQKIIIEVPSNNIPLSKHFQNQDSNSDFEIDMDIESLDIDDNRHLLSDINYSSEYVPEPLGNKIDKPKTLDYIPTHIASTNRKKGIGIDDVPIISKILNPSNESPKDNSIKDPQFVVTLDGLDPNIFLEKKLQSINEDSETEDNSDPLLSALNSTENETEHKNSISIEDHAKNSEKAIIKQNIIVTFNDTNNKKKISNISIGNVESSITKEKSKMEESNVNSNSKLEDENFKTSTSVKSQTQCEISSVNSQRKRKASPIVFNSNDTFISKIVKKSDGSKEDRSAIASKYDSLPSLPPDRQRTSSLSSGSRETKCKFYPDCKLGENCEFYHPTIPASTVKQTSFCRAFPACPYGNKCAYAHPPCKFNTTCVRKDCPFSHEKFKPKLSSQNVLTLPPIVASRVVTGMNYKSISAGTLPAICKFYPNCINPECHWYHPKPCRFGKNCVNKTECNFYHYDLPSLKWKNCQ